MNGVERIEILSSDYLDTHRKLVEKLKRLAQVLKKGLGWHYLLDLAWAASELDVSPSAFVVDAGAGVGLMQWWLAEQGVNVVSVDSISRANINSIFRERYQVEAWIPGHLSEESTSLEDFVSASSLRLWRGHLRKIITSLKRLTKYREAPAHWGRIYIYNSDLSKLDAIKSNSMDAVISISALEHNTPTHLSTCVAELMRTLKPDGKLVATLAAARDKDWYHGPSRGWCYTEGTLRRLFGLGQDCLSNYDRYDELFEVLRNCGELRDSLSDFYFKSGDNGMPWGIWNPKYQPVGVVKVKRGV